MISYLKGTIVEKSPTRLLLDVNDIGYDIHVTLNGSRQMGAIGSDITVLTYLHIREDLMQLYGFISRNERDLFVQLLSIPGIGPKKALAILSGSNVKDLQHFIVDENVDALTLLPGVGKKIAQRLIIDLKDKLASVIGDESVARYSETSIKDKQLTDEAVLALTSLGYHRAAAQKAVQDILKEETGEIDLEKLIKRALRNI